MAEHRVTIPINIKKIEEARARAPKCPWCFGKIAWVEDPKGGGMVDQYTAKTVNVGDISICSRCFAVMEWTKNKKFERYIPTPEEQEQVDALIRQRFPHRART